MPRIPRNIGYGNYTPRKVTSRDKPSYPSHNPDGDNDHLEENLPEGILPEQYKSIHTLRLSERRNQVQARTAGRGWSCPKHVCYRPMGKLRDTESDPHSSNSNQKQDQQTDVTTEGAELVALRLQDAQAMFSGEDVNPHRHKNNQPFTQLGKFHFKPWKPTYHATALPRHVDEALFHSLKRSKLRVCHAKVCGGGGSRLQNVASSAPVIKLTQEDYEDLFADEEEDPTSETNQPETTGTTTTGTTTTGTTTTGTTTTAPTTMLVPTRPTPSTILKHGHEVLSPRVLNLLKTGDVDTLQKDIGVASKVYFPYTSRHPKHFPLRIPNYKEYVKAGGNMMQDENNNGGAAAAIKRKVIVGGNDGNRTKSEDEKKMESIARQQGIIRRNFEKYYTNFGQKEDLISDTMHKAQFKNAEERKKLSKKFYRKLKAVPPRKRFARGSTSTNKHGSTSKRARPPTPGLPRAKINRPAERLHEVAQKFITCRVAADQQLLVSLDTIERERGLTIKRKKRGMTDNQPQQHDESEILQILESKMVSVMESKGMRGNMEILELLCTEFGNMQRHVLERNIVSAMEGRGMRLLPAIRQVLGMEFGNMDLLESNIVSAMELKLRGMQGTPGHLEILEQKIVSTMDVRGMHLLPAIRQVLRNEFGNMELLDSKIGAAMESSGLQLLPAIRQVLKHEIGPELFGGLAKTNAKNGSNDQKRLVLKVAAYMRPVHSSSVSEIVQRPDWTWEHEIKSMRLVADVNVLEEMIDHAKKHVWYMTIIKAMHENPNDPTKTEIFLVNLIHRILSYGVEFDQNCFLHILCNLNVEEYVLKTMQETLHQLREVSGVSLEQYSKWCTELNFPESLEAHEEAIHLKRQQEAKQHEHEVLAKKMQERKDEQEKVKQKSFALSAF